MDRLTPRTHADGWVLQEEAAAAAQQAAAQQTEGEEAGGDWQGVEADIEKLTLLDEEAEEDKPSKAPQPPQVCGWCLCMGFV